MLHHLRIRNLAVIEAVDVEFEPGFNVLSGETGAGKSILVEAVGLLLGGRATPDLIRTGEAQATLEAVFEDHTGRALTVRREITAQGRSRALIDGTPGTAARLRDLAGRLVELHGQHEHHALLDPLTHLPVLDDHAGLVGRAAGVASRWAVVRGLREQLDRARMDGRERTARLELIAFQLGEIERASPQEGEDEGLAGTRQILAAAERVSVLCQESYDALYESDAAALSSLGAVWKRVGELAQLDDRFAPYMDARDGIKSQLEDLAYFLRDYAAGIDASPARLQEVEERLALLERLKRKYGPTLQDVIERGAALTRERQLFTEGGQQAGELEKRLATATQEFLGEARELSRLRRAAGKPFADRLAELLAELAMARTRFEVRFNSDALPDDRWNERGIDEAEFYVSPNPGEELRPLARVASGGELSRIMLALKTLAVEQGGDRTLVFDEVDAGIGGRVADVVGWRLRALGERFQVLCITHLPQIAAHATTQFRIDKSVRGDRTVTTVTRLDRAGRIDEIGRMMGGALLTDQVRGSAEALIDAASALAKGEDKPKAKAKRLARPGSPP